MQNMRRRLQMLERLPQFQPRPSPLEQIKSLALRSLSEQDLELLRAMSAEKAAEMRTRELSEREVAACAAWGVALETEARRMGLRSWAEAERAAGKRR
jgi:hypothetical protein